MPLSKREADKRANKPLTNRFINAQMQLFKELGIPDEYINRCKVRARLQCKTEGQAANLISQMKLNYLLSEDNEP